MAQIPCRTGLGRESLFFGQRLSETNELARRGRRTNLGPFRQCHHADLVKMPHRLSMCHSPLLPAQPGNVKEPQSTGGASGTQRQGTSKHWRSQCHTISAPFARATPPRKRFARHDPTICESSRPGGIRRRSARRRLLAAEAVQTARAPRGLASPATEYAFTPSCTESLRLRANRPESVVGGLDRDRDWPPFRSAATVNSLRLAGMAQSWARAQVRSPTWRPWRVGFGRRSGPRKSTLVVCACPSAVLRRLKSISQDGGKIDHLFAAAAPGPSRLRWSRGAAGPCRARRPRPAASRQAGAASRPASPRSVGFPVPRGPRRP